MGLFARSAQASAVVLAKVPTPISALLVRLRCEVVQRLTRSVTVRFAIFSRDAISASSSVTARCSSVPRIESASVLGSMRVLLEPVSSVSVMRGMDGEPCVSGWAVLRLTPVLSVCSGVLNMGPQTASCIAFVEQGTMRVSSASMQKTSEKKRAGTLERVVGECTKPECVCRFERGDTGSWLIRILMSI